MSGSTTPLFKDGEIIIPTIAEAKGEKGEVGPQGPKGEKGDTGLKGDKGDTGKDGFNPYWKTTGSTILVANNGERDLKGAKGDKGDTGPQGLKGATGATGDKGPKGATGAKGDKGDTGPQGLKGADGAKGNTGPAGKDGFNPYWKTTGSTILVANNGERDLKGAKGDKGDTGAKGDTGLKGDTGPQGLKGDKGDAGSDANVTKDNVEIALGYTPLPQSGGLLNDYVEKLVIIGEINSINLDEGNTFLKTISADTTFSIDNTKTGAHSFTLIIEMNTLSALTFPTEVKWQDGEAPDMSEANKTYILTFLTIDNGLTWFGMKGGTF